MDPADPPCPPTAPEPAAPADDEPAAPEDAVGSSSSHWQRISGARTSSLRSNMEGRAIARWVRALRRHYLSGGVTCKACLVDRVVVSSVFIDAADTKQAPA